MDERFKRENIKPVAHKGRMWNDEFVIRINNISEESYSKQTEAVIEKDGVSYNTTSYRLDLTGAQISTILVNVLNTLKRENLKGKITQVQTSITN